MILQIEGFRCYDELQQFCFNPGDLTLITGRSGIGKSTIFQAIYWVLYGGNKGIYPQGVPINKRKPCTVILEYGKFIIHRQANPGLLTLTNKEDGKIIEDDEAQSVIKRFFGHKELWSACSYISQGSHCSFLTGSNDQKLDLLNHITFNKDNPTMYIEKIDGVIKFETKQFTHDQAVHTVKVENYIDKCSERAPIKSDCDLTQLEDKLNRLSEDLVKANEWYDKQVYMSGKLKSYNQQLEKNVREKSEVERKLSSIDYNKLKSELEICGKFDNYLVEKVKRKNKVSTELRQLTPGIDQIPLEDRNLTEISMHQIKETERLEREYSIELAKCDEYSVDYNKESIEEALNKVIKIIDDNRELNQQTKILNKIKDLEDKLRDFNLDDPELNTKLKIEVDELSKNLDKLKHDYEQAKRRVDILNCPTCDQSLIYNRGTLVQSSEVKSSPDELNNIKSHINETEAKLKSIVETVGVVEKLIDLKSLVKSELLDVEIVDISVYELAARTLRSVKIIELPELDSITLKRNYENFKLIQRYNKLENELIELKDIPDSINYDEVNKRKNLERELKEYNRLDVLNNRLLEEINSLKQKIAEIVIDDKAIIEVNKLNSDIKAVEIQIDDFKYYNKMKAENIQLKQTEEDLDRQHQRLINLNRLRETANNVECQILESTLDAINCGLNEVLSIIFNEPIVVKMCSHRDLKTKKIRKQEVNLKIYKGDSEYDNFHFMSGGEKDRISLALILALNRMSDIPFLLLDECMSSLNVELRKRCIDSINQIMPNKYILCINHEDIQGYYDNVVYLEDD